MDSTYNAFVTGYTCSANFPTLGSFQKGKAGTCFAFVTRFNAAGNALVFSTLIGTQNGGSNEASGIDIALDAQGNVIVVGETNATDFLPMNPLQPSYGGLSDAFISKLDPCFFRYLPAILRCECSLRTVPKACPVVLSKACRAVAHTRSRQD